MGRAGWRLSDTLRLLLFGVSSRSGYTNFGQCHALTDRTLTELAPVFGKMSETRRSDKKGVIIIYRLSRGLTAKAER
jgi:hypothetical protein